MSEKRTFLKRIRILGNRFTDSGIVTIYFLVLLDYDFCSKNYISQIIEHHFSCLFFLICILFFTLSLKSKIIKILAKIAILNLSIFMTTVLFIPMIRMIMICMNITGRLSLPGFINFCLLTLLQLMKYYLQFNKNEFSYFLDILNVLLVSVFLTIGSILSMFAYFKGHNWLNFGLLVILFIAFLIIIIVGMKKRYLFNINKKSISLISRLIQIFIFLLLFTTYIIVNSTLENIPWIAYIVVSIIILITILLIWEDIGKTIDTVVAIIYFLSVAVVQFLIWLSYAFDYNFFKLIIVMLSAVMATVVLIFSDDMFNIFDQDKSSLSENIKKRIGRIKILTGNIALLVVGVSSVFSSKKEIDSIVTGFINFCHKIPFFDVIKKFYFLY